MAKKIRFEDKDIEIRKEFDKEIAAAGVELTKRSNPMKLVQGGDGNLYLCDQNVNESGDLIAQHCMNYDEIAVPRHA